LTRLSILARAVRLPVDRKLNFTIFFGRSAMQYLLLIYQNEAERVAADAAVREMSNAYREYTESIAASGNYKGGNALQSTRNATTVRVRNGKRQTTDGPFAETREQLAGYYLVDASDLDEAISLAERIPGAKSGSIEVRPVQEMTAPVPA
jgi:hypothetical protein